MGDFPDPKFTTGFFGGLALGLLAKYLYALLVVLSYRCR